MTDRIDPPKWPSPRGPWPEVGDVGRLYDHGWPWCVNAAAHPDVHADFPDPERHLPWHECHSEDLFIDGARRDMDGQELDVSVYAAAAFRFGKLRDDLRPDPPRVVIETWPAGAGAPAQRVSLSPGEALRMARILVRLADKLTFVERTA